MHAFELYQRSFYVKHEGSSEAWTVFNIFVPSGVGRDDSQPSCYITSFS